MEDLRDLLSELLNVIQTVMESGEELPDELQGVIAETLRNLMERIDRGEGTAPTIPQPEPELAQAMPSSNVDAFGYDPEKQRLLVRFLGKYPQREGPIYAYDGVPKMLFELFRKGAAAARTKGSNKWGKWWKGKSPSMGASVYTFLKLAGFPYQRLT